MQDFNLASGFKGSAMSVYNNRLFVINSLSNSIANFEIELVEGHLSLYFSYEIPQSKEYKLGWIHALSEYEMLVTC